MTITITKFHQSTPAITIPTSESIDNDMNGLSYNDKQLLNKTMTNKVQTYFDLTENFNKKYNDFVEAYEVFEKDKLDDIRRRNSTLNALGNNSKFKIQIPYPLVKPFESFMDQVKMICALYLDKVISENVFTVFKSTIQGIIDDEIIDKFYTSLGMAYKQEDYAIIKQALNK